MTPENVAKANELLETLKFYRKQYERLKRAKEIHIQVRDTKGNDTSWFTTAPDDLYEEVKNKLFEQAVGDIARTEEELTKLGVKLPQADFIDPPAAEALQADPF